MIRLMLRRLAWLFFDHLSVFLNIL
jgi:hypothetical protein